VPLETAPPGWDHARLIGSGSCHGARVWSLDCCCEMLAGRYVHPLTLPELDQAKNAVLNSLTFIAVAPIVTADAKCAPSSRRRRA
jgi:hypothetical protein